MHGWLDVLIPRDVRADPDRLLRFRVGLMTLLSSTVAIGLFLPVYMLLSSERRAPEIGVLVAMALNPLLGGLVAHTSRRITLGLLVANTLGLLGVAALAWFTGGARSFALGWFLALLAMAGTYGSRPLIARAVATTIALIAALLLASLAGLTPAFDVPREELDRLNALFVASALALVAWSGTVGVRARQRNSARLRAALAEADAARADAIAAGRARDEFLSMISHELRTPMNGILGGIQLLSEATLAKGDRTRLADIDTSARRLQTLLEAMLDFSRLNTGPAERRERDVALPDLLEEVRTLVRPAAGARRLDLVLENRAGVLHCRTDPGAVRTILLNLLGNAVKFTAYGRVTLVVLAHRDRLRFEVHDSGPGIAAEAQPRLFDAFRQADGSLARRHEGAGLGLATCKRLVEQLEGEIGVVSMPGLGSVFWFEVPLHGVTSPRVDAEAMPPAPPAACSAGGTRRVLLVEDNVVNQKVATAMLQRLGCTVSVADNGLEALDRLAAADFDLVLMDIQMPELDGIEATRRIRAGPARTRDIPVLALTADVLAEQRATYTDAGMDGMVAKPIDIGVLARTIGTAFGRRAPA